MKFEISQNFVYMRFKKIKLHIIKGITSEFMV
jgi:hypothetical protein